MSSKYYDPRPTDFDPVVGKTDFLLSNSDIKRRGEPKFKDDPAVLSLIKFEGAVNCLLTFRKFDDYGEDHLGRAVSSGGGLFAKKAVAQPKSPKDRAHGGVLGRLFTGARAKLIEVRSISM